MSPFLVTKRDGNKVPFSRDRLLNDLVGHVSKIGIHDTIDLDELVDKVTVGLYDGITTSQLSSLAADTAAAMVTIDPGFAVIAAAISVACLHKETSGSLVQVAKVLKDKGFLSDDTYETIIQNKNELENEIDYQRDYWFDFFGFKTLERAYLTKINNMVVERPQHMLMRVAVGIHGQDIKQVLATYHHMSKGEFTHATPTLFNAGTNVPQLSSCFLVKMKDDSIDGIYDTLKECALISKSAGGIGLSIHDIRSKGSHIKSTNGNSNGLVPMIRVFNETARYVDQGGGKRKGAFALYIEPWHADIFDVLDLRKNHGKEEQRARDLFFGLWVNDLFMKRVKDNAEWTLFDPASAPGLSDVWGKDFDALYCKYEGSGMGTKTIKAQQLWWAILSAQVETGTPYILYKDACNMKSNHQHLGTIKSSNLCTEIIQYTSSEETSVCNLASVALPKFVKGGGGERDSRGKLFGSIGGYKRSFDFQGLREVVRQITRNLNRIIDVNYYPVETARRSNLQHRPVGIGIQGLADVFITMGLPFESDIARKLNRDIFETIYFAALEESCELARIHGPYPSYEGSPVSKGVLQFDMWNYDTDGLSGFWDWKGLRECIAENGVRNSLLVAPMPTASTSQILGNNEAFEPYTSNIYVRRVLSGEFVVVNQHLAADLKAMGMWSRPIINALIADDGSVQDLPIPQKLKDIYKTVWEIKQKVLVDMSADRGVFIDQSQSFNVFMPEPDFKKLTSCHFYAWQKGLKTGMYYLRTRPAADAIKFTVDKTMLAKTRESNDYEGMACRKEEGCVICSA